MTENSCVFCQRVQEAEETGLGIISFEPKHPVVDGHLLFVPTKHVRNAGVDPTLTGLLFLRAAEHAKKQGGQFNLITSSGKFATQTVAHLHIHYVPREEGDELVIPWGKSVE